MRPCGKATICTQIMGRHGSDQKHVITTEQGKNKKYLSAKVFMRPQRDRIPIFDNGLNAESDDTIVCTPLSNKRKYTKKRKGEAKSAGRSRIENRQ